jgi:dolichol-phosphate mannosyltransferase
MAAALSGADGAAPPGGQRLDLAVVIPVYNEEGCIRSVLSDWLAALENLSISFRIFVLNDGSTDGTARALDEFRDRPRVHIVEKANSGHGPTILQGYAMACPAAGWVFQCDSDNELSAGDFPPFWAARGNCDAVVGIRTHRAQSRGRRLITAVSRAATRALCGAAVQDVNAPYRLMRADLLARILETIPPGTFAPNILIAGSLSLTGARVLNLPVRHAMRRTGTVSIVKWRLWRAAARSFLQLVRWRLSAADALRPPSGAASGPRLPPPREGDAAP